MRLPSPKNVSPYFNTFDKPFTSRHLANIKQRLTSTYQEETGSLGDGRVAAVLIPLCNVNGKAGILFELRGKLRHHAGEVRLETGF